jgi:hypothetical protein
MPWTKVLAGKPQKRSSIRQMEARFHRKSAEDVLHKFYGSPPHPRYRSFLLNLSHFTVKPLISSIINSMNLGEF